MNTNKAGFTIDKGTVNREGVKEEMINRLEEIIKFFKEENKNPKTRSRINSIVITNLELGWLWAKYGGDAERVGKQ